MGTNPHLQNERVTLGIPVTLARLTWNFSVNEFPAAAAAADEVRPVCPPFCTPRGYFTFDIFRVYRNRESSVMLTTLRLQTPAGGEKGMYFSHSITLKNCNA